MFSLHAVHSSVIALSLGSSLLISGAASAQTVLSYSPWLPAAYVVNDVVMPWMEQVEAVTEGRVKIVPRAAGVGAPREQFDVVRDGLADVSLIVPGYTQGRFPLLELGELPLLSSNSEVLAPAFYRQYRDHLAQYNPYAGTHVLSAWVVAPAHITTSKKAISTLADLKGLKLFTSSAVASMGLEAVGAVPVTTSIADTYSMASTGVIDGALNPFEPTLTWNLYPFLDHITVVPGGMSQAGMALLINERKWQSISEADRAAIMEISGEPMAAAIGRALAKGEQTAATKLRELGVTIEEMPPLVFEEFSALLKPIDEAWFAKAKKAGLENPEQVLAEFRAELNKAGASEAAMIIKER